jgi:diadenosine hexaphosphate hydrolase (ATP-forming)
MNVEDRGTRTVPQGGAIVFRTDGGSLQILLVRAKKDPDKWIFPKGHLLPGESHAQAALREAAEEAGIAGIIVGLVGPASTFRSGDEDVTVEYYLLQMVTETQSSEERSKKWVAPAKALEELAFEDARDLLRIALPELEGRLHGSQFDGFRELLLHEYDHLGESLLANEESGEKRVAFFITLCGAVGAGLGFVLGKTQFGAPERLLVGLTSIVLLLLGYATFVRVVTRNAASDRYKNQLSRVRQYFLCGTNDPHLAFLPFCPYTLSRRQTTKMWGHFGKGGWLETVALIEALLVGGLVAFAYWTGGPRSEAWKATVSASLGVAGALIAWVVLLWRAETLYKSELAECRDGSVPLRGKGGPFPASRPWRAR